MGSVGTPLDAAVARVWGPAGQPVGAAFLAAPNDLITAAHVVNLALGRAPEAVVPPEAAIEVDFPMLGSARLSARVVRWVPPSRDQGAQDVAGLHIEHAPADAGPVPLARVEHPFDRRVVMLGFPSDDPDGTYAVGRLRGAPGVGWAGIDVEGAERFAAGGFSGAPVWDVDAGTAVGMIGQPRAGASTRAATMTPAASLFMAWPRLTQNAHTAGPFPGLRSFREQDAASFFGRTEMLDRLDALTRVAPVVCLLGPGGTGKSSLLHAGLLPILRTRTDTVVAVTRPVEAATPLRSLALALERARPAVADPAARAVRVTALTERLRQGRIPEVVESLLEQSGATRLALVVDQLEEAFGAGPGDLRDFGAVLVSALGSGVPMSVVSAVRADFLGDVLRHPALAPLAAEPWLVSIGEPRRGELREAVLRPFERPGPVEFEPALPERMLGDLGVGAGRLPLLQFALAELWSRQEDGRLSHLAYDEMGRVEHAMARHAERVWAGLGADQQKAAERLLVQLVTPVPEGQGFTRRVVSRSELDPETWTVAARLATARLLTLSESEQTGEDPEFAVELGHEALISHWSRLTDLAAAHREFRRWQEGLRRRATEWSTTGRPAKLRPTSGDLRTATHLSVSHTHRFGRGEQEYLASGRVKQRTRLQVVGVAAVLVLILGYVVFFWDPSRAVHAANDLAAKSGAASRVAQHDPYGKMLLALRGYRTRHTGGAADAIDSVGRATALADVILPDYSSTPSFDLAGKVSRDGRMIVATTADERPAAFRVDAATVGRVRMEPAGLSSVSRATIGARGTVAAYLGLATRSADPAAPRSACTPDEEGRSQLCIAAYDLETGQVVLEQPLTDAAMGGVVRLSVDATDGVVGALVEGGDGVWRVQRWRADSGAPLPTVGLPGTWDDMTAFWLTPGGGAATVLEVPPAGPERRGGMLAVVDLAGGRPRVLDGSVRTSTTVGASADGTRVASLVDSSSGPVARVWDVATGRTLAQVRGPMQTRTHGSYLRGVALDPSGARLTVTSLTGSDMLAPPSHRISAGMRDMDTRASVFSIPGGKPVGSIEVPGGWTVVRPLAPSDTAPVAFSNGTMSALVLPASGRGDLTERTNMMEMTPSRPAPDTYRDLCAKLIDRTESAEVTRARPDHAYVGDVCG